MEWPLDYADETQSNQFGARVKIDPCWYTVNEWGELEDEEGNIYTWEQYAEDNCIGCEAWESFSTNEVCMRVPLPGENYCEVHI